MYFCIHLKSLTTPVECFLAKIATIVVTKKLTGLKQSENNKLLSKRKSDHIKLAFDSQMEKILPDDRFYYEPVVGNINNIDLSLYFADFKYDYPIWISSMTGGTQHAGNINRNLAKICNKYNLGMGLGSCRQLLYDDSFLEDFNIRKYIGNRPLFANLGIAQIEELTDNNQLHKIRELIDKLDATGLIVHINPLQEFVQSEGNIISQKPVDTIKKLLDKIRLKIIVKEVGQGMGPGSLSELMKLPLYAIEFGAFGGTNFTKLELLRNEDITTQQFIALINVGHDAGQMIEFIELIKKQNNDILCDKFIISGGIKSFLDGYYYTQKLSYPSLYGMASGFLKPAMKGYEELELFVDKHIEGLKMANAYLKIKN